ncbi:killer suppression protein HigA [Actinobacillus pleuropneumoniae]|nr:killer suppression protein HigA [Actinobacillus pleuropneumoniae]
MDIYFKDRKLEKAMNNERDCIKMWGADNARKIMTRMAELKAADNLSIIPHVPPARLHLLTGNRAGQFSVSVKDPFRIIFKPEEDPPPYTTDGGIDKNLVTKIRIIEVGDYHGQ